jgi:hypothetical protein
VGSDLWIGTPAADQWQHAIKRSEWGLHLTLTDWHRVFEAVTAGRVELVRLAKGCGLIRGEWVAIDGSNFRAVASIDTAREKFQLQRYLDSMEKLDNGESPEFDNAGVQAALGKEASHVVADAGYSNGEQAAKCECNGILPCVPARRTRNPHGNGTLFQCDALRYQPELDTYLCPGEKTLKRKARIKKENRSST